MSPHLGSHDFVEQCKDFFFFLNMGFFLLTLPPGHADPRNKHYPTTLNHHVTSSVPAQAPPNPALPSGGAVRRQKGRHLLVCGWAAPGKWGVLCRLREHLLQDEDFKPTE